MPKLKKFWKKWIFVILIVILFLMVMGLNSSLAEYFRLTEQRREMTDRIENLEATQYALETQIALADSDKAVEEWARTYQRYVQPGDQVIIRCLPRMSHLKCIIWQPPHPARRKTGKFGGNYSLEIRWHLYMLFKLELALTPA